MSNQFPPPPPPGQPPYWPPPQPPKKRHIVRNILAGFGAFIVLIIIIAVAANSGSKNSTGSGNTASIASSSAAAPDNTFSASSPSPSPTVMPPTEIEFVITGNVPAGQFGNGPTVDYGSDSDTHNVNLPDVNGTVTYKMPFNSGAQYYSLDVNIPDGNVSCKIVAIGPAPDAPTTVSQGTASGSSLCRAQAAPENSGLNWTNEQ